MEPPENPSSILVRLRNLARKLRAVPSPTTSALAATLIFTLGVMVTLLLWRLLQHSQDLEIERATQAASASVSNVVESWVDGEYEALRRRAALWSPASVRDGNAWYRDALPFLAEHPAFTALARLQGGEPSEIAGSAVALLRAREAAGGTDSVSLRGERVVGPIPLEGGRQGFCVQIPLSEDLPGVRMPEIVAVLEPAAALAHLLDRQAPGYEIALWVGDTEIFAREAGPGTRPPEAFARRDAIRLGLGDPWTLHIGPSDEVLGRHRSEAPRVVLLSGLVISVLIAALFHIGQLSRERERALQLNVDLRDEVKKSRLDESEIRVLNEDLERRVRERTAELNETIAELETFNYSVSHDLRSPLGAVINFAAILKEDYDGLLDATGREYLDRLISSARVAVSMMDALLAFSRSGRDELHKTQVPMRRLVEDVVAGVTAASPGSPAKLRIDELPDAWADAAMMRFVFMNLIGNACKFAKPGEAPHVEVGGHATDSETTFYVRDHGVGFDMRYADKLFKVFERLHRGEQHAGHGVGLAIVARMVRRHGGRVWAQGAVDKGATFHFSLPTQGKEHNADRIA